MSFWKCVGPGLVVAALVVGAAVWFTGSSQEKANSGQDSLALRGLPYAGTAPFRDDQRQGLTLHKRGAAADGINVYTCTYEPGASFLDMEGRVIGTLRDLRTRRDPDEGWELVVPCPDDGYLVLIEDRALFKINAASAVVWEVRDRFHHDMAVGPTGDIFALRNQIVSIPRLSATPVIDNHLTQLSATGETVRKISLLEACLKEEEILHALTTEKVKEFTYERNVWDPLHANSVNSLEADLKIGDQTLFHRGQILVCMRHLDLIAVVDMALEKIVWHWGIGTLDNPHHPSLLKNGHILVFDNGTRRGYSRILEVDPVTGEIVETIDTDGSKRFFTATRGSAQRLPNGNTLIVEGERGRVFELTPDRQIVWEFLSFASRTHPGERELLYRMPRWTEPDVIRRVTARRAETR